MTDSEITTKLLGRTILGVALAVSLRAQTNPFQCIANVGVPPIVRAEGTAELAGDVLLTCTGGSPTPAGQPIPQFNLTVFFATNVTSKVVEPTSQFSEALLIVDEPASATNPSVPVLNCGNSGAPDSSNLGPGVCQSVGTGNPSLSYGGTPNGYGSAQCDGSGGRPSPNSYGCGRPNVFQARIGTPQTPGQLNAITFFNVPIDPPGAGIARTFRITNIRVNAALIGVSTTYYLNAVSATISVSGPFPITIVNPQQTVAFVQSGLNVSQPAVGVVRVSEGFSSSWKAKNIAFATGNGGVAGNASFPTNGGAYWTYNGGRNYPPDVAQNVPGAIYNTETGFEWQNNASNGPPSPNPPRGTGVFAVSATAAPLNSVGYGGVNTGIASAGIANSGTRIAIRFGNIPAGASVQVPSFVNLTNGTSNSGVLVLTSTDAAGAGGFSPGATTLTASNNLAVYEVLWADPFSIETGDISYTLAGAPSNTNLQITAGFAPFYSDSLSQQPNSTRPVPRFLDAANVCGGQSCLNVSPSQGTNWGPVTLTVTSNANLNLVGAQVTLHSAGLPDILGAIISDPALNVLTVQFNLAAAAPGARDVVVSLAGGGSVTLAGGFVVLQSPTCAYSVSPSATLPASSGAGTIVVAATPAQCAWSATTTTPWITLLPTDPSLPMVQAFTVTANTGVGQRTGSITIAGENVPVSQDGTSGCSTATLSPASKVFDVGGGTLTINVTAPAGCSWAAVSNATWVTVTAGASGAANGAVAIQASANSSGPLSGTLTIAGQTFNARQSGSACGATDVSSQVSVTPHATLGGFFGPAYYTQQLQIVNQGASSVPGPVYLVVDGVPFFAPPILGVSYGSTTCNTPFGYRVPLVQVSNGLNPGQAIPYLLKLISPASVGPVRVFSGTPNQ